MFQKYGFNDKKFRNCQSASNINFINVGAGQINTFRSKNILFLLPDNMHTCNHRKLKDITTTYLSYSVSSLPGSVGIYK